MEINWNKPKSMLVNWIGTVGKSRHNNSPEVPDSYRKALFHISEGDLAALLDNRIDCLLFDLAKGRSNK